jgi:dipeptidase E
VGPEFRHDQSIGFVRVPEIQIVGQDEKQMRRRGLSVRDIEMKLYLSSYKLGGMADRLKQMAPRGTIGYIANALDFTNVNVGRRDQHIQSDIESLEHLSFVVSRLDLRTYFGRKDELRQEIDSLGALFVSGGNVFILRQAMRLSGLDELLLEKRRDDDGFVYAGYSAAGCVLAPDLRCYAIVDKPETPYPALSEVIWDGLSIVDFALMPHWNSDHAESADIDKEIDYCRQRGLAYLPLRDGDVHIIEKA